MLVSISGQGGEDCLYRCAAALVGMVIMKRPKRFEQINKAPLDFANPSSVVRQKIGAFAENCFACHGPDEAKRKARLRLDLHDIAVQPAKSGAIAIVPGSADKSELIKRTTSQDDDERMPPIKTGKRLTPEQLGLLRRWIDQGAEYKTHRFFLPPQRPELPVVNDKKWPRNPIDYFILARLEQDGLKPAAEANRRALIRRIKLDLLGLPPTPAEVDEFLSNRSADAYERLVDRFLASPHFGERMAVDWLDAARFADTHGFHIDSGRDMTHWRDWVKAFGDPEINTRIAQYEMAFKMQTSVPELTDLSKEPKVILDRYGIDDSGTDGGFARNCLLARRMVERGVRFVQLMHRGWDQHSDLPKQIRGQCRDVDKPSAALIQDLKERGLLEDTLVIWGGEFGRTVYSQGTLTKDNHGRDHHGRCFTMCMAGGGVKPGITYGETDDFCYNIVRDPVHIHDYNATILRLLGIEHTKLTYRFAGRDFRLTDVHGQVVDGLLA
jgi:Protein of unknown function (DUF1501)/Protein of unknown function (DUF1549)/Planctomycete cytochrome C